MKAQLLTTFFALFILFFSAVANEPVEPSTATATIELKSGIGNIIAKGSNWLYFDSGSDLGSSWTEKDFDDSQWPSAHTPLGYGEGFPIELSFGKDKRKKHITTYFRKKFNLKNANKIQAGQVRLRRDDGAVVYLNGTEILRSNMPNGKVLASTKAESTTSMFSENKFHTFDFTAKLLHEGENIISVEIHQATQSSSDIIFDLELNATDPLETVIERKPYLQQGGIDSIIIRWRSQTPFQGTINYGLEADKLDQFIHESKSNLEHRVLIENLKPNTKYYYSMSNGRKVLASGAQYFFHTAPEPGKNYKARVWVIGDAGTANKNQKAVYNAYRKFTGNTRTDLWLMLGDNAYSRGTDSEYTRAVFDIYPELLAQSPTWPAIGNHEVDYPGGSDSADQTGPHFVAFDLPKKGEIGGLASGTEAYYSFDYANIHFICLDSADSDLKKGGVQYNWLEKDLKDTTAKWLICFFHHPPYTKGSHDSDKEKRHIKMRENFLPLLEKSGVDLVLGGHSHSYERSYLIDNHYGLSSTFTEAHKKQAGDGRGEGAYHKKNAPNQGAIYIVAGSSGKLGKGPLNHPAMATSLRQLGSVVLDFENNKLNIKFLRENGLIEDHLTIIKE